MTDRPVKPLTPEAWAPHVKAWQDERLEELRRMARLLMEMERADGVISQPKKRTKARRS